MRYDDRTAEGRLWYVDDSDAEDNDDVCGELDGEADLLRQFDRGEKLYNYLDKRIWKQNEAKRAASIIMFNCLHRGRRSNAMFIGPSGCGKTYIWRCLQELFPERIEIVDGSNITPDGWSGKKKWSNLLLSEKFLEGRQTVLVIDEADKMFMPKTNSRGENWSEIIQGEVLKMLEGTYVDLGSGVRVDTSMISFVFCGAFSVKSEEIAEKKRGGSIGFVKNNREVKAYDAPIERKNLHDFGIMTEILGRIRRIVNLKPMTEKDFFHMMDAACSPIRKLEEEFGVEISLMPETCRKLVSEAAEDGEGIRGMENKLCVMLEDALYEEEDRRHFVF
ncbi:AAA family ATPase [Lachnospiraceae bacterium 38-10]